MSVEATRNSLYEFQFPPSPWTIFNIQRSEPGIPPADYCLCGSPQEPAVSTQAFFGERSVVIVMNIPSYECVVEGTRTYTTGGLIDSTAGAISSFELVGDTISSFRLSPVVQRLKDKF